MKCLSLHQPWATLVAIGAKRIETRPWWTSHRGRLAIHATKTTTHLYLAELELFAGVLGDEPLPLGAVVAICDLKDVVKTEDVVASGYHPQELPFGDFSFGRFAWLLDLVEKLDPPVPARGYQRLWEVEL